MGERGKQLDKQKTKSKASEDLPPCEIRIDKEGCWFHQGAEIINKGIVHLFYASMEMEPSGRCVIAWKGERCYVEVEDAPFVVKRVAEAGTGFTIHLNDETVEALSPETLTGGKDHVLYCRVKNGRFPARFNRPAYYQLAEHIEEEEGGGFFIRSGGKKYPITFPAG